MRDATLLVNVVSYDTGVKDNAETPRGEENENESRSDRHPIHPRGEKSI